MTKKIHTLSSILTRQIKNKKPNN